MLFLQQKGTTFWHRQDSEVLQLWFSFKNVESNLQIKRNKTWRKLHRDNSIWNHPFTFYQNGNLKVWDTHGWETVKYKETQLRKTIFPHSYYNYWTECQRWSKTKLLFTNELNVENVSLEGSLVTSLL